MWDSFVTYPIIAYQYHSSIELQVTYICRNIQIDSHFTAKSIRRAQGALYKFLPLTTVVSVEQDTFI